MSGAYNQLKAAHLLPHLIMCGYSPSDLIEDVEVTEGHRVALTAFARPPHDSRSACIAVIEQDLKFSSKLSEYRSLGAPLVFVPADGQWELWSQAAERPKLVTPISPDALPEYFSKHRAVLAPESVYRAKTWARFDTHYQLSFVDVGLMPLVEEEAGRKLSDLIERVVTGTKERLGWAEVTEEQGRWMLKANFWLLAARILKDKDVPSFAELDLEDVEKVFGLVAEHYAANAQVGIPATNYRHALQESAREISRFGHLGVVSTEVLSYIYENALITKATRRALGTHSTPAFLVDYIVGKLRPWIVEIPQYQRQVFEPACGHAAFLVAAMRLLGDILSTPIPSTSKRHAYFRQRLHGFDFDDFALEIARLSLTLADVPNPNGWDLRVANMFRDDLLARYTRDANIILANPPFERFEAEQRPSVSGDLFSAEAITISRHNNQAAEMMWRVVTNMQSGAVFGMVLPQGILHDKGARRLRDFLTTNFEISEICLFPDKVFNFSGAESAVILGRRIQGEKSDKPILYRHIRYHDVDDFKQSYRATNDYRTQSSRFSSANDWNLFIPDLEEVWDFCSRYPKFEDIATIGKGFDFRSLEDPKFPEGAITVSSHPQNGLVEGFEKLQRHIQTHELPKLRWLNLDPAVIRRPGHGTSFGIPQVLLNYARVSRGPWRLKAFIDKEGHPFTSRFLTVRPNDTSWPLEAFWGICNSPFANAYSFSFSTKRDVLTGQMRAMPVPNVRSKDLQPLLGAVGSYLKAAQYSEGLLAPSIDPEMLKVLHWRIDAEVLRLYQLPPRLERQLLDLFSGAKRRGVPFTQEGYLEKGFSEPITLSEQIAITIDWDQTNARRFDLITKNIQRTISSDEKNELDYLQQLTDARIRLLAPLPTIGLDTIE